MSLLKVTDLEVSYGGIDALRGISFDVEEGEIVTLIGANGAGKSTTLRTICGLVRPSAGRIVYDGRDITSQSTQRIVSEGVALVPEGRRVFDNLTVKENLLIGAYLRKDKESNARRRRACLRVVPTLEGAGMAIGGHALGRRAADAGGRPRNDDAAAHSDDGRAVAGVSAPDCKGHF